MRAQRMQTTLAGPCSVSGRGYWSGASNTVTFVPAPVGSGIRFIRDDLPGKPRVRAVAEHRYSMPLRTRLSCGAAEFDMVEHAMAAVYGLQIDNVDIHCTAPELPGLDGSSHAFVLAIQNAGRIIQKAPRETLRIAETIHIGDNEQFIRCEPLQENDPEALLVEYRLDYGADTPIGQAQYNAALTEQCFASEIAPARTFISQADAEALQSRGIATHVTERDLLVFDEHGPVHNTLRYVDECARHKTLDLIGDLALTGCDLIGRVTASRSGHQMNGNMAEELRKRMARQMPNTSLETEAA